LQQFATLHEARRIAANIAELPELVRGNNRRFWEPSRLLAGLVRWPRPDIALSDHLIGDGAIVFEHACRLGCEGIVSKRLGSHYRSGRVKQ
jgi:hypothetical protein